MDSSKRPETMARITTKELADAFIEEQVALVREQVGTKKVLLKWGRLPHLMRRSAAEVTVVFEDAKPCTVYALSSDGSRRGEVPVVQKGGKVSFVANTARDPAEATCYYEIIRIWYN